MKSKKTKIQKVFDYMKYGKTLTPAQAYEKFGTMRLPAIIHELKRENLKFATRIINKNGVRYAQYKMI